MLLIDDGQWETVPSIPDLTVGTRSVLRSFP